MSKNIPQGSPVLVNGSIPGVVFYCRGFQAAVFVTRPDGKLSQWSLHRDEVARVPGPKVCKARLSAMYQATSPAFEV